MTQLQPFQSFEYIRKVWDDETQEWWYSVQDVIEALIDTPRVRKYWDDLKRKEKRQSGIELSELCGHFPMQHKTNGRTYQTECSNREGMLRIIQAIPSPQAEPFKQWLASVGNQYIEEVEDPSKALKRVAEIYRARGYSEPWISKRLKHHEVRSTLISEWNNRGVDEERFDELLDVISHESFGMKIAEYKQHKGLDDEDDLQDHMWDGEIAISILGEVATNAINDAHDIQGYDQAEDAATRGGRIAQSARRNLEQEIGGSVTTNTNYLSEREIEERRRLRGRRPEENSIDEDSIEEEQ